MSVDRLETRLRQLGIASISDVKYATIEVSGQLGYELNDNKQLMTKEDFQWLMSEITQIKHSLGLSPQSMPSEKQGNNIFKKTESFEGESEPS